MGPGFARPHLVSQGYRSPLTDRSPQREQILVLLAVSRIVAQPKAASRGPLSAFYKQAGGAYGRRGMRKECYKAAERASWARDPKVQERRREILERWREQGLTI
jgi:hypothetical protein